MKMSRLYVVIFFLLSTYIVQAQAGLCPPNIDFENGDFTNWQCYIGTVTVNRGANQVNLSPSAPAINRHTIIPVAGAGVDFYGGFSQVCPNGSGFSVKLGNDGTGSQAEGIEYIYNIPSTATTFSILYQYAVVLQDPGHSPEEQPRFQAKLSDLTTGTSIPCVTFDFTASASLPGFKPSPRNPGVLYKDWTPITINLGGLAGHTIKLEFITSDCTRGGHFGYAYVDVNSLCNGAIAGTTICQGDTAMSLTAPFGFEHYNWYADNTFTSMIDTSQVLNLNPAPTVGTIFPVVVMPYPGFGCQDTLYATLTTAAKPISNAGADQLACKFTSVQIGAPQISPLYAYSWLPATGVSNPAQADPMATVTSNTPVQFVLKTTDKITGCFAYDTTFVTGVTVDTAMQINGPTDYCSGKPLTTLFSVNNSSTNIQWYESNTQIPGATNATYHPTANGSYWAAVTQSGCSDSSSHYNFTIHDTPLPLFVPVKDTQCITNNNFSFTNTSSIPSGEALSYYWTFGDGSFSALHQPTKNYNATGKYDVWLYVSSPYNCVDSLHDVLTVMPNAIPDFKWDSVCLNRPVRFTNLSSNNGSPQVSYLWDFKNGTTSTLQNPSLVTYADAGWKDVTLEMTALGCETAPQLSSKSVLVNDPASGVRYRDITIPEGHTTVLKARTTIGNKYSWSPATQLNSATIFNPVYTATDDQLYFIDITDGHSCVTRDTIQVYALKKPGHYLPSAFTPNGDGLNETIQPYLIRMKMLKRFSIFNRSGNLIFTTTKEGEAWDGRYRGVPQDVGVYVWTLEYIDKTDKVIFAKGTITLIR